MTSDHSITLDHSGAKCTEARGGTAGAGIAYNLCCHFSLCYIEPSSDHYGIIVGHQMIIDSSSIVGGPGEVGYVSEEAFVTKISTRPRRKFDVNIHVY